MKMIVIIREPLPVLVLFLLVFVASCSGWRAVPANQASHAAYRAAEIGLRGNFDENDLPDDQKPRHTLHSIYKFGWCEGDATSRHYLRRAVNTTIQTQQDSQASYFHLLVDKHTMRFALQCIVMKAYVPKNFEFRKSRLPIYYCQGTAYMLMLNTVQKIDVHEFYLREKINLPINFRFEFYHPHIL